MFSLKVQKYKRELDAFLLKRGIDWNDQKPRKRSRGRKKTHILAPKINKPGASSIAKRGAGVQGNSSGGKSQKLTGFGEKSESKLSSKPKSSFPALGSAGKAGAGSSGTTTGYGLPSSQVLPKSSKNKTAFGILWIPTKKHNRHKKEMVYSPHRDDRSRDRSPSMYNLMSGDSHAQTPKKKENDEASTLLVADKPRAPTATTAATVVATAGAATATAEGTQTDAAGTEDKEKTSFIQRDTDENKEASGDTNGNEKEYLENNESDSNLDSKNSEGKWEKNKLGDKVDSVYLRPPPPHKTRSNVSSGEDQEDCGIKCLYYTLQCCDCVLM